MRPMSTMIVKKSNVAIRSVRWKLPLDCAVLVKQSYVLPDYPNLYLSQTDEHQGGMSTLSHDIRDNSGTTG